MTVLNFPPTNSQPSDGSFTYTANGVVYTWDGEKWTANTAGSGGMGTVHFTGDSPPPAGEATETDQWFNTNDGRLYTYTKNENGVLVWVDASPDSDTSLWERTGTTLVPTNDGDDVDLGTGDLSATKVDTDDRIGVYLNNPPSTPSANVFVADDGTSGGTKVQMKANGDVRLGVGTGSFSKNSDGIYHEGTTGTVIVTKDDAASAGTDSAVWRSGQFGLGETITMNADGSSVQTGVQRAGRSVQYGSSGKLGPGTGTGPIDIKALITRGSGFLSVMSYQTSNANAATTKVFHFFCNFTNTGILQELGTALNTGGGAAFTVSGTSGGFQIVNNHSLEITYSWAFNVGVG